MLVPPVVIFIFILSFLVFIHELGHFLTARKFGVDVEEFGLGIPPKAWGKKIGRTFYSINWLPFGGFVKIKGEDFTGYDPKDKSNFINKKPWQKTTVLIAGIVMNIVLGAVLFYISLGLTGWKSNPILLLNDYTFKFGKTVELPNVITFIEQDSPAYISGIQFGDRITELSYGEEVAKPETAGEVRDFFAGREGLEVGVKTENIASGDVSKYVVYPKYSDEVDGPAIGIGLSTGVVIDYSSLFDKIGAGFLHSLNVMGYSFFTMKGLIVESVQNRDASALSQGVAGPVGIFGAVKSVLDTGGDKVFVALLDLSALLSLSLAVMNLLPFPALDGGRIAFVLVEWATGKRPSPKLEDKAHKIGFIVLIALLLVVTLKDIVNLLR